MRTYFRRSTWRYWAGTIEDLLQPTERAITYIGEHTGSHVQLDAVVTLPGQQIDAETVAELRESIRDHDVPLVDTLTIKVGSRDTLRLDLDVNRRWGDAVTLRTRGTNEVAVNGLHATINSELDRGRRISYEGLLALRVLVGLVVGAVVPALIFVSGLITVVHTGEFRYSQGDGFLTPAGDYEVVEWLGPQWAFAALGVLPLVAIAVMLWGHTFAIRDLELLRPGETRRYAQVSRFLWAALALLVVGPIAGVLWAALLASH